MRSMKPAALFFVYEDNYKLLKFIMTKLAIQ